MQAPKKLGEALQYVLARLKVEYVRADGTVEKVKVEESPETMLELARLVLAHPLVQALSPGPTRTLKRRVEEKAQELQAKTG